MQSNKNPISLVTFIAIWSLVVCAAWTICYLVLFSSSMARVPWGIPTGIDDIASSLTFYLPIGAVTGLIQVILLRTRFPLPPLKIAIWVIASALAWWLIWLFYERTQTLYSLAALMILLNSIWQWFFLREHLFNANFILWLLGNVAPLLGWEALLHIPTLVNLFSVILGILQFFIPGALYGFTVGSYIAFTSKDK